MKAIFPWTLVSIMLVSLMTPIGSGIPVTGEPEYQVMFAYDLSGSMHDDIDRAKSESHFMIVACLMLSVSIEYGVMTHVDYNGYYSCCGYSAWYGTDTDYPYRLDEPLTDDIDRIWLCITDLTLYDGRDSPECYARIAYEGYSDQRIYWREDVDSRGIVHYGDSAPHWCEDGTGCDPGPDAIANTGDDLDFQQEISALTLTHNIEYIFVGPEESPGYAFWADFAVDHEGVHALRLEMPSLHIHILRILGIDVSVGGLWVPVDKFGLLAPYIGLASTLIVATAATAIHVKRVKRRTEKQ